MLPPGASALSSFSPLVYHIRDFAKIKVPGQPHQIYDGMRDRKVFNYPVWGTILITPYKRSAVRGEATTPPTATP
jgi:hypothetical protein